VAKILVADDNSNIQKMVGLALKDQGIDVVAVGNGEAAVRKISDVRPDLVLADVFMPVRNGYEVCRYVKADSSLAHIPVILLVGAFDPLDEQEAQRVGADGVLKKPFVPPDPLISMVKSALVRASAGQVASLMDKPTAPAASVTPANDVPTVSALPTKPAAPAPEPFVEDTPARPQGVKIDSANQPLAFGKLLETSPATAEEDIAFVTPSTQLPDRNWHAPAEEEEEEDEESSEDSWRRDGGNEAFAEELEKTGSQEDTAARRKRREAWTPTREKKQDLIEAAAIPEIITEPVQAPAPPVGAPAASATPGSWISTPPLTEHKSPEVAPPQPTLASTSAPEIAPAKDAKEPSAAGSWFSVSTSPWDAEAQKASQLAASWDAAPAASSAEAGAPLASSAAPEIVSEPQQADSSDGYEFVSEAPSEEPVFYSPDPALVGNEVVSNQTLPELISDGAISPETVESLRLQTSYALEDAAKQAQEMSAPVSKKAPEPEPQPQAQTAPPDMDALVAKVLSKLSPEMLQAVTRELLKPIVETLVRDELKTNK
jgi:CheY-like chemotaxis protein